jgi:hypothetical protein
MGATGIQWIFWMATFHIDYEFPYCLSSKCLFLRMSIQLIESRINDDEWAPHAADNHPWFSEWKRQSCRMFIPDLLWPHWYCLPKCAEQLSRCELSCGNCPRVCLERVGGVKTLFMRHLSVQFCIEVMKRITSRPIYFVLWAYAHNSALVSYFSNESLKRMFRVSIIIFRQRPVVLSSLWWRWSLWLVNRMVVLRRNSMCWMNTSVPFHITICLGWDIQSWVCRRVWEILCHEVKIWCLLKAESAVFLYSSL